MNNIEIEISPAGEKSKVSWADNTVSATINSRDQKSNQIAWASFYRYKQELTSKLYSLQHRLRLFNVVITPALSYASGTWTPSREHERMTRSIQRKILRLIVQTKRKHKRKPQTSEKESHRSSDEETVEGSSSNKDCDQDSDVSSTDDNDNEIDTDETEEEDRIEFMKHSFAGEKLQPKSHVGLKHTENEMAIGSEHSIATRRTMGKECSKMELRPQHQTQDTQISGNI